MKKIILTSIFSCGLIMNAIADEKIIEDIPVKFSDAAKYWDKYLTLIDANIGTQFGLKDIKNDLSKNVEKQEKFLKILKSHAEGYLHGKSDDIWFMKASLTYYNYMFSKNGAIYYLQQQAPDFYKKITTKPLAVVAERELWIKHTKGSDCKIVIKKAVVDKQILEDVDKLLKRYYPTKEIITRELATGRLVTSDLKKHDMRLYLSDLRRKEYKQEDIEKLLPYIEQRVRMSIQK